MNNSLEGAEVKERKKPGPKPKLKEEEVENVGKEVLIEAAKPVIDVLDISAMNDLARRIWEGQSISLPLGERVARIRMRLKEKGYTEMEQIELPTNEPYKKYL